MGWCVLKIAHSVFSWWKHLQLACVISEWHRSDLRARMKKAGIKPRWAPLPPRLGGLPSNLMVLSWVMLLMSRVGMDPFLFHKEAPVTWVEALGGVRSFRALPFTLPPPPEPPPFTFTSSTAGDREGDVATSCCCGCVNPQQCCDLSDCDSSSCGSSCDLSDPDLSCGVHDPALEDLLQCQFIHGPDLSSHTETQTTNDSLALHVAFTWFDCLRCCLSQWPSSFGPLGLLAHAGPELTAIVDTGASMSVTPFKDDFENYETVSG